MLFCLFGFDLRQGLAIEPRVASNTLLSLLHELGVVLGRARTGALPVPGVAIWPWIDSNLGHCH